MAEPIGSRGELSNWMPSVDPYNAPPARHADTVYADTDRLGLDRIIADAPLPLSCSVNLSTSLKPSAFANASMASAWATRPWPLFACPWVETRM
jgi:hypothetical protein